MTSAIVAVVFASLAFLNLVLFRVVVRQKASREAWIGATLGIVGVAVLSGGEALRAGFDARALTGIGLALLAVTSSAVGNYFSWKGQQLGTAILPQTGWAMAYGTAMLVAARAGHGRAFQHRPVARIPDLSGASVDPGIGRGLPGLFRGGAGAGLCLGQLYLGPDPADRHAGFGRCSRTRASAGRRWSACCWCWRVRRC